MLTSGEGKILTNPTQGNRRFSRGSKVSPCCSSNMTCMTSGVTFGVQPSGRLDQKVAIHELRQLLRRRIGKKRELFIGLISTGSRYELLCWV
ncbi:unnamed protein product [Ascophyllum nodosum]